VPSIINVWTLNGEPKLNGNGETRKLDTVNAVASNYAYVSTSATFIADETKRVAFGNRGHIKWGIL